MLETLFPTSSHRSYTCIRGGHLKKNKEDPGGLDARGFLLKSDLGGGGSPSRKLSQSDRFSWMGDHLGIVPC